MARLVGVDLPRDKRIEVGLTYIYGIGLTTSKKILAETGVDPDAVSYTHLDVYKRQPQTGVVLAVGEGKLDKEGTLVPVPVKVGDKVIYGKYGGTEIHVDGEDVLIVRADDLYAVFE